MQKNNEYSFMKVMGKNKHWRVRIVQKLLHFWQKTQQKRSKNDIMAVLFSQIPNPWFRQIFSKNKQQMKFFEKLNVEICS